MSQDKDALDELGEAIEKARGRGLLPKGGSWAARSQVQRRFVRATNAKEQYVARGRGGGVILYRSPKKGKEREAGRSARAMDYLMWRTIRPSRVKKSIDALDDVIEKARYTMRLSPAQRRNAVVRRAYAQNEARGRSKYRGGFGRSKTGPSKNVGARGPQEGPLLRMRQAGFRRRDLQWMNSAGGRAGENSKTRQGARAVLHEYARIKGRPSPYKRKLFGRGLKRIRKGGEDIHKAKPKTLYVYRPVENAADIIAWAESQGFKSTQPAEKLHVTLAYSKTPLNWAMLHDDYHLEPSEHHAMSCGCEPVCRSENGGNKQRRIQGGVREVKALGADGAVVLAFESDSLTQRWMDFKRAGAVWSFPSFTPHITITYNGKGVDLSKVHPYAGDIVLGEECWEEISEDGQDKAVAAEKVTKAGLDDLNARLAAVEAKQAEPSKEAA